MKPKLLRMEVPLFKCGDIYLCRNKEELSAFHKKFKLGNDEVKEKFAGYATTIENQATGCCHYLIFINDQMPSTIAHEAAHVAFYICRDVGVTVNTAEANETFCYLISAIVDFIYKHIKTD